MNVDGGEQQKIIDFAWPEAVFPDASRIAFSQLDSQGIASSSTIRVLSIVDGASTEVGHIRANQTVLDMAWSPSGETLAYIVETRSSSNSYTNLAFSDHLYDRLLNRGGARDLGEVGGGLSFSPDGAYLLSTSANRKKIEKIAIDSGARETVFETKEGNKMFLEPRFSPDGLKVAFLIANGNGSGARLMVLKGNSATPFEIRYHDLPSVSSPLNSVYDFSWSPDSQTLAVGVGDFSSMGTGGGFPSPERDTDSLVYVSSLDQKKQEQLPSCTFYAGKFSPDGHNLVCTNLVVDSTGLYQINLSTKAAKRLTNPGNGSSQDYVIDWR